MYLHDMHHSFLAYPNNIYINISVKILVQHLHSKKTLNLPFYLIGFCVTNSLYLAGYQKDIFSGKATLQELAATESDCSSAKNEGDLGFFGPGQMQSKHKFKSP